MTRLASSFALAGWGGFGLVSSLRLATETQEAGALAEFLGLSPIAAPGRLPNLEGFAELASSGLLASIGAAAFIALAGLNSKRWHRRVSAEPLAAGVLTAFGVFWGLSLLTDAETAVLFGWAPNVAILLAASFGALLFDPALEPDAPTEEDERVEALLAPLERSEAERHRAMLEK